MTPFLATVYIRVLNKILDRVLEQQNYSIGAALVHRSHSRHITLKRTHSHRHPDACIQPDCLMHPASNKQRRHNELNICFLQMEALPCQVLRKRVVSIMQSSYYRKCHETIPVRCQKRLQSQRDVHIQYVQSLSMYCSRLQCLYPNNFNELTIMT